MLVQTLFKRKMAVFGISVVTVDKSASTSLGKTVKILPGMIAQVDIISGEKTVMEITTFSQSRK